MSRDFNGVRLEVEDGLDEECFVEIQLQVPENGDGSCNYYDNFTEYLHYQEDPEEPPLSLGNGAVDVASGSKRRRRSSGGRGGVVGGGTGADHDESGVLTRSRRLKVRGDQPKVKGKGKDKKKTDKTVTPSPVPVPVTRSKSAKSSKSRSKSKVKQDDEVEAPPKPVVVKENEASGDGTGGGGGKKASRRGKRGPKGRRGKKRKRSLSVPSPTEQGMNLGEGLVSKADEDNDNEGSLDSKENLEIVVLYPQGILLDLETPPLTASMDDDKDQLQLSITNDDPYAYQGQLSMTNAGEEKTGTGNVGVDNENLSPDYGRRVAFHTMAASFRKFRSLPKAYRWMYYEFFYSDIDRALFLAKNDFEECLREYYPKLKTRYLRRAEWNQIRQKLGKPRRFSSNFLLSEMDYFESARNQIRRVQRRQLSLDVTKDLPDEIPLQLNIGTRVSAMVRLQSPGRITGIYRGTVDGLDPASNSYRITFDFKAIGTQSVIDYEVQSDEPPEIVSTASISMKMLRSRTPLSHIKRQFSELDIPALASELPANGLLGGFSVRFLEMIVRLRKLLQAKRNMLQQFRGLNTQAEKMCMNGSRYPKDFLVRYSICIVSLDYLNARASPYFKAIDLECEKLCSSKQIIPKVINPDQILNQCDKHSEYLVTTFNLKNDSLKSRNERTLRLIASITSLMLQLKTLSSDHNVWHTCDVHSIKTTVSRVKDTLEGRNLRYFQNRIEMPISRIAAGIVRDSKQGKSAPNG